MTHAFKITEINTPLGAMLAIADEHALYFLEFMTEETLEQQVDNLTKKIKTKSPIATGLTTPLRQIKNELNDYFKGNLTEFTVPLFFIGSTFQQKVWQTLQKIPYGTTCSYMDMAVKINRPTAFRAVARANATNRMAIIVPCHRVINHNGKLGGYASGLERKTWLLDHERANDPDF